jgi:hypothetical protein
MWYYLSVQFQGQRVKALSAVLLKIPVSWNVTPCRWVKSYRFFEGLSVSIFRTRHSGIRELLAQRRNITYKKNRINSTAVTTSNLALCNPVTRPNCSTLKMKALRTFDPKLAHLLFDLAEIWYTSMAKGNEIPVQAWTVPEGSRRLRFPDFMTISVRRW